MEWRIETVEWRGCAGLACCFERVELRIGFGLGHSLKSIQCEMNDLR